MCKSSQGAAQKKDVQRRLGLVTVETFRKCANEPLEQVTDEDEIEHKAWIVPEPFCAICYIGDDRCLPGKITLETKWLGKRREKNMKFL